LGRRKKLTPAKIQRYLGAQAAFLENQLTDHPEYRVDTLPLCNGQRPKKRSLRRYLVAGEFEGKPYKHVAILNVGSGPAYAPTHRQFNPRAIPRVRASQKKVGRFGFRAWLRHFDMYPKRRYVSDGNPDTVTIPKGMSKKIDRTKLKGARLVILGEK